MGEKWRNVIEMVKLLCVWLSIYHLYILNVKTETYLLHPGKQNSRGVC